MWNKAWPEEVKTGESEKETKEESRSVGGSCFADRRTALDHY